MQENEKNKHEPAYPTENVMSERVAGGVSKLEYFAARAPKIIPKWFQPCLDTFAGGEMPKVVNPFAYEFGFGSDHPHKDFVEQWYGDDGFYEMPNGTVIPDGLLEEIAEWEKRYAKYAEAKKLYYAIKQRETIAQWPWYWANIVLDSKYVLKSKP